MPVVSLTLEDANKSILSKAYFKVIQDITSAIKIPHDTLVVLHKDNETTLTDNRVNVSNLSVANTPSTISKSRITAFISENYNEDAVTSTAVHQQESYPVFIDTDINVYVYPLNIKSDISIEFTYTTSSKSEATRIRDDMRIRLSQSRNIMLHDIEYDIILPAVVEDFIADIHELKSRLLPNSLETYVREHTSKSFHIVTDMSNVENVKLAVREKQVRIVGMFDFSTIPDKLEINNSDNNYKLNFTYKLSFDVPRAIVLRYPVIVCNKVLPNKYIEFIQTNKVNSGQEHKRNLKYTNSMYPLSLFEAHRQLENRIDVNLPLNIPLFDDFTTKVGHKGYAIVTSFLTEINEIDKRTLLNLRDIDPYYIQEEILDYILNGESSYIVNPYMSFMYLGLYQDDIHFDNSILEIDADLNIKSKVNLTLLKPVRVTLSVVIDISCINNEVINRMINVLRDDSFLSNSNLQPVLFIFLNEYIRAHNNFKTENLTNNIPEYNFYMFFIRLLIHYTKNDSVVILSKLLEIYRTDEYIYTNVIAVIKHDYLDLLEYLVKKQLLDINTTGNIISKNLNTNSYGNMKTVMNNYIMALRE